VTGQLWPGVDHGPALVPDLRLLAQYLGGETRIWLALKCRLRPGSCDLRLMITAHRDPFLGQREWTESALGACKGGWARPDGAFERSVR